MKRLLLIILSTFINISAFSQRPEGRDQRFERKKEIIKTAKIGYITQKLNLSEGQSEKFWPIYNEYSEKRREIKKQLHKIRKEKEKSVEEMSEADINKQIELLFELRQKELDLDKTYKGKFLEIITSKQLIKLYKAEKEFMMLLRDKAMGGPDGERRGPRNRGPHGNHFEHEHPGF